MHIGRRNLLSVTLDPNIVEHLIPYIDCTLQERHMPIADTQAKGRRDAEGVGSVEGKKWGDGKVEVVLDPTTAPYWFALALGKIVSNPLKTHNITQSEENEPLTATIWRERNVGDAIDFPDSVVDVLELSFADDVAKLSIDIMSKYPVSSDESPGEKGPAEELKYYTFRNALVEIEGIADPIKVRELTLRIENGAELIFAPNDNVVDKIAWKALRVSGSFKLLFEDETQKDAFNDPLVKQKMTITFNGDGGDTITIEIPKFRVDNWTEEAGIDDLAQEGIDFVAECDTTTPGSEKTISVEVINKVDKYITL